jgi:hypothetical protein
MQKNHLSYSDFSNAWSTWMEFYNENNSCPYSQTGDCPEPCPVNYTTRSEEAQHLWDMWCASLPEGHWLRVYRV